MRISVTPYTQDPVALRSFMAQDMFECAMNIIDSLPAGDADRTHIEAILPMIELVRHDLMAARAQQIEALQIPMFSGDMSADERSAAREGARTSKPHKRA